MAICTIAAHDAPEILVFMALLFLWMFWKKESSGWIICILLIASAIYIIQDLRHESLPVHIGSYKGSAEFQQGFRIDGDSLRGFLELDDGGIAYATYRFHTPEEKAEIEGFVGNSRLRVTGVFEDPRDPAHKYSFDMKKHLQTNGASSLLTLKNIEYQEAAAGFTAALSLRRENLKRHIRSSFPESLSAEAEALLIGERESITSEQQRIQQTLGISHLFAISGLHVGIISGLLYLVLLRCGIQKETAMILLLMILPLYAFLAGGAPSVWRAVSMTIAVLGLKLLRIRMPIANILLLSFILFIGINPYIIYKIGFQLSYGASFGIIFSLGLIEAVKSPVRMGLLITFLSQFTLYPILLFHFYGISLSSFAVNSLFVPLYTLLILPMNIILLILTFLFRPAADFLFFFYEPFRIFIEKLTVWLAEWPHQMWIPGKPEGLYLALMITGVVLFYSLVEKGFRWWKAAVGVLPAIIFTAAPYFDSALKVTFIDVGQGDSALIELPYRSGVYLIDTGGVLRFGREGFDDRDRPFEVGRQVVAPYLHGNGITAIDKLILTHPDADHAEGADEILQLFDVEELHISPGSQNTEIFKELVPFLNNTTVRQPGQGSHWQKGDMKFTFLSPGDRIYEGNNDSLVLLVEYEEFKLLFTGDLEIEGENRISSLYGDSLEDMTLLKVGHHGSKTSSGEDFLMRLQPEISVFSAGKNNRYGHPAEEVVKRFESLSLQTLSTAEQGTIEIIFRNGGYQVTTSN